MYCPRCGEPLEDDSRFCKRCGYRLVKDNQSYQETTENNKPQKGKAGGCLVGVATVLVMLFACVLIFGKGVINGSGIILEDEHVTYVKNGSPSLYPSITYGDAFGEFFSNEKWRYFESDDGKDVVEFTGNCLYHETEVEVRLQFILNMKESTFDLGYMAFNEVPQANYMTYALVEKVFDSYQESHYSETFSSSRK